MELPAEDANDMDEEGHYFDFIAFYKKVEFSDRAIRLEILEESRQDLESKGEASSSTAGGPLLEAEEVPVCSLVLAAKSRVLRTMLSNGMKESDKSAPVILKVNPEEKEAFKELLHFLYAGSLSPRFSETSTNIHELINLLVVGDKYEVPSFMGAVTKCINNRDRNVLDSTTLVQKLSDNLSQRIKIRQLADQARAHIVSIYKDVSMTWDSLDFLNLRVEAVEILLQSEDLEADCEEEILGKVLVWLRANFPENQERKEVFVRLAPLVRFTRIRGEQLVALLSDPETDSVCARSLILGALRFRAFSDEEKRKVEGVAFERRGVQAVHLEILGMLPLEEEESIVTKFVPWCGKSWFLEVQACQDKDIPTVAIYLCCENEDHDNDGKGAGVKAHFRVSARTWPDGLWKFLFQMSHHFTPRGASEAYEGELDALKMSWDEAKTSEVYTGGTGVLTLKVEARRISEIKSLS